MYCFKSTKGEETLKTEVKLTHLRKFMSKTAKLVKHQFLTPLLRDFEKSHASNQLIFSLPLLFQCDQSTTTLILLLCEKAEKSVNRSKKKRANTIQIL